MPVSKLDNQMIFRIILIVLAAFVLFALVNYYNSKQTSVKSSTEKFYQDLAQNTQQPSPGIPRSTPALANQPQNPLLVEDKQKTNSVNPAEEINNSDYRSVDFSSTKLPSDCFPRDRLSAEDLLPGDAAANSKWAQVNPAGQGDVSNQNFLTAGWAVGINTVGSTLRNANLSIRSEPPNPRGPGWGIHMSTIESDVMRKPLEIGGDC